MLKKFCKLQKAQYICTSFSGTISSVGSGHSDFTSEGALLITEVFFILEWAISSVGSEHSDFTSEGALLTTELFFLMERAISSVGSEHLVYTQRVGGSNPSSPTFLKASNI